MRKSSFMLAMILAVLMTMVFPAVAAELHEPHQNTNLDCKGDEVAVWHFVANQTRGEVGDLVVKVGDQLVGPIAPSKVTRGSIHWWVEGPAAPTAVMTAWSVTDGYDGEITDAVQLPGKLVISDAYCEKKD